MTPKEDMIERTLGWMLENLDGGGQEVNWTVAITNTNEMIISKVGGVTSARRGMQDLAHWMAAQEWQAELDGVCLAKKFTRDAASNHAEMCILAAARSMGMNPEVDVDLMGCPSLHCEACANTLDYANVTTLDGARTGSQQGWCHPYAPMAIGLQYGDWAPQLEELDRFNEAGAPDGFPFEYARQLTYQPAGDFEPLELEGP
ncbi:hypothetical protein ABT301_35565 [Streptomyces sp. NPDC000987]|uniref:hypothetical protein n=1 Tax=Streptomyces sp. NPDC000987 TaxID=3154374 RepID=UPI00331CD254